MIPAEVVQNLSQHVTPYLSGGLPTPQRHIIVGIVLIRIHNDAVGDLRAIRASDPEAFPQIFALLEQLKADPKWINRLLDSGYGSDRRGPIAVMKWHDAQRVAHLPLWRLKFWNLEKNGLKYRVIYLYNYPDQSYNVMAVVHRDKFDYDDPNDPVRIRIFTRCRKEFPRA